MSDRRARDTQGPLRIRIESGKLFSPDTIAARIENMLETDEGTLRSIIGPVPYGNNVTALDPPAAFAPSYGIVSGIHHSLLRDRAKELLLIVSQLEVNPGFSFVEGLSFFAGSIPTDTWQPLYTFPMATTADIVRFPTQFESTPNGVVVIPQMESRPYFVDAEMFCSPLGYSRKPGPPSGAGPDSTLYSVTGDERVAPNQSNYAHDRNMYSAWLLSTNTDQPGTQMHAAFGRCRLGTTHSSDAVEGSALSEAALLTGISPSQLLLSSYEAAVQWVDKYGNFSPISPRSEAVVFEPQFNLKLDTALVPGMKYDEAYNIDDEASPQPVAWLKKQVRWTNITTEQQTGSKKNATKTVGRLLLRTKDITNTGDTTLYIISGNAIGGALGFATIPDNISTMYPDNTPDSWLSVPALDVVPMPGFKLCRMALGKMWFANAASDPGLVRWSMPGRWGTLLRDDFLYPDPGGGEITGLWAVKGGLLIFTRESTFLATVDSQMTGLSVQTLSSTVGCVAPSSIATLDSGLTLWLGKDGFYGYVDGKVAYASEELRYELGYINQARMMQAVAAISPTYGEYRCWVPMHASKTNNVCWVYDGKQPNVGWRRRSDIAASAVCTTKDHRSYMLAGGVTGVEDTQLGHEGTCGIYLLDHHVSPTAFAAPAKTFTIETAWLLNEKVGDGSGGYEKQTPVTVYFWLRETTVNQFTVSVYRDWRKALIETATVEAHPVKDPPPFWGTAVLNAADTTYRRKRPYWTRAQIFVPSCEVFKLEIKSTDPFEFMGLSFDYIPHPTGGARVQP